MLTIPQQKVAERWDELPYNLREAIFSEENADILENIAQAHNFDEAKLQMLSTNVGDVLRGFMHPNNLTKELINDLKIDEETAMAIAHEISSKIFKPIHVDIEGIYKPFASASGENTEILTPRENQGELIKPMINPRNKQILPTQTSTDNEEIAQPQNQPFILHNEEEIQPTKEAPSQSVSESPIFYKPTFSEEYKKSVLEKEVASIELGEETEKKKQPESFKTPIKEARIVHYSEFRTPLGPFENQRIQRTQESNQITPVVEPQSEQSKTFEVHPNNVVDLKDLPL